MPKRSDEIEEYRGVPFTRKEAEDAVLAWIRTGVDLRHGLLALFERRAHNALGFVSFEEFAKERLGIEGDTGYLKQMRAWARVERDALVGFSGETLEHNRLTSSRSNGAIHAISARVAAELQKLPPEARRPAFLESVELGATGKGQLPCIKRVVTRRLNEANGVVPQIAPPPTPKQIEAKAPAAPAERPEAGIPATEPSPAPKPEPEVELLMEQPLASVETHPFEDWLDCNQRVSEWLAKRVVLASPAVRKHVSTELMGMAHWVATGGK